MKKNMKETSFHSHPKVNETHIKMYGLKYSIDLKLSSCNHIIALKGKTSLSFSLFCYNAMCQKCTER